MIQNVQRSGSRRTGTEQLISPPMRPSLQYISAKSAACAETSGMSWPMALNKLQGENTSGQVAEEDALVEMLTPCPHQSHVLPPCISVGRSHLSRLMTW